jgi:hypothetical protein
MDGRSNCTKRSSERNSVLFAFWSLEDCGTGAGASPFMSPEIETEFRIRWDKDNKMDGLGK